MEYTPNPQLEIARLKRQDAAEALSNAAEFKAGVVAVYAKLPIAAITEEIAAIIKDAQNAYEMASEAHAQAATAHWDIYEAEMLSFTA